MRRFKKGELTQKILAYFGETSKNLFELGTTIIFDPRRLLKGFSFYQDYSLPEPVYQRMILQRINYLKRKGYLKKTKSRWEFTTKGRIEIIKTILYQKFEKKKWDGKWRIIIFDIPELSRKNRDFLRRELKWIGFKELQKSVWILPYEMERAIMALLKLWKLEFQGDIRFLVAEKISDEGDIKEYFALNKTK